MKASIVLMVVGIPGKYYVNFIPFLSFEPRKIPWLVGLFRGSYYPAI